MIIFRIFIENRDFVKNSAIPKKTNIFQVSGSLKSFENPIKINANAERGDRSAKLGVKVDLGWSWAAFGQDLRLVWASKLEPS